MRRGATGAKQVQNELNGRERMPRETRTRAEALSIPGMRDHPPEDPGKELRCRSHLPSLTWGETRLVLRENGNVGAFVCWDGRHKASQATRLKTRNVSSSGRSVLEAVRETRPGLSPHFWGLVNNVRPAEASAQSSPPSSRGMLRVAPPNVPALQRHQSYCIRGSSYSSVTSS